MNELLHTPHEEINSCPKKKQKVYFVIGG
ncbi:hypothetical protein G210_1020 [Candida maltosa Xu316]|uniref:Uncharacterized protein n=1 Tax=Candida maltosa (strain Xu316) TaxID=1245528 RepID=M3HLV0_CANMX|nr:hypothetical protein G210_1020 [Candida maltosa Xu316]